MSSDLPSRKIKDIQGQTFGRLTVLSFSHVAENRAKSAYWKCKCSCGNETIVCGTSLRIGGSKSCGCLASELSRDSIKRTHNIGRHLYFIRSGEWVKIGRSNNVKSRLKQIQSLNPLETTLLRIIEDGGELECEIHDKYKLFHHKGEWFKLRDDEIEELM